MMTASTMKLQALRLRRVGNYPQQFRRSWTSQLDGAVAEQLVQAQEGVDRLSTTALAGVASQLVSLGGTPQAVEIPGGWGAQRLAFELDVEMHYPGLNTQLNETVRGYTEPVALEEGQPLPEDLQFFINDTEHWRQLPNHTPGEPEHPSMQTQHAQVLSDFAWGESSIYQNAGRQHRLRPEDVFSTMSRVNSALLQPDVMDMRTTLTGVACLSRYWNLVPAYYLHSLLDNYRQAAICMDLGEGEQDILAAARGRAMEPSAPRDPFLSAMGQVRGAMPGAVFTLRNLNVLLGEQVLSTKFLPALQVSEEVYAPGDGQTLTDTVAATIMQAGMALVSASGYQRVRFNMECEGDGQFKMRLLDAKPSPTWRASSEEMLRELLDTVLFADLSERGVIPFSASVLIDTAVESTLHLAWGGLAEASYRFPSFASALLSPVVTGDVHNQLRLAQDIHQATSILQEMPAAQRDEHSTH